MPTVNFISLELVVDPARIALLKYLLEGFDGLASLSTLDRESGRLVIRFFSGLEGDVMRFLASVPFVDIATG